MLKFYTALASRVYRGRVLVWFLAALGVAGFGATLISSQSKADEAYMLMSLMLLLWSLCLLVVVYTFIRPVPCTRGDEAFLKRVRKRLARGVRWVLAWTMTLLCLALVYVSFRAGRIALDSLGI